MNLRNINKIKVFLSESTEDVTIWRNNLEIVLQQANMEVIKPGFTDLSMNETDCSIHILGNNFEHLNGQSSIVKNRFLEAKELNHKNENYKIFIWQPTQLLKKGNSPEQEQFIHSIRNQIYRNMIFLNHESPVLLVEDMRSIIYTEQKTEYKIEDTEVFYIYNEIDEDSAEEIVDLLSDVTKVRDLSIVLNSPTDYSELISQQIEKSKLTIIYFKRTLSWAIPFVQQVWKRIGGASSDHILWLIGDSNISRNHTINISIPNIEVKIVAEELIPLEIKVLLENQQRTN